MIPGPKAGETAGQSPRLTRPAPSPAGPAPQDREPASDEWQPLPELRPGGQKAPQRKRKSPLLPEEPAAAADLPPEGPAVRPPEKGGGGRFW